MFGNWSGLAAIAFLTKSTNKQTSHYLVARLPKNKVELSDRIGQDSVCYSCFFHIICKQTNKQTNKQTELPTLTTPWSLWNSGLLTSDLLLEYKYKQQQNIFQFILLPPDLIGGSEFGFIPAQVSWPIGFWQLIGQF